MKITFILPMYPRAPMGGYKVVYEYANRLAEKGHAINLIYARKLGNVPEKNSIKNRLLDIKDFLVIPKTSFQEIDKRVKRLYVPGILTKYIPDADAIFATFWATAEYVLDYPDSKGVKFYLIQSYETWSGSKDRVDKTWLSPLNKVVIAKWLYQMGLALGVNKEKIIYIPNAIDNTKYRPVIPIENRNPQVCMMYSYDELKGTKYGLETLILAKEKFPSLKAVIFGVPHRPAEIPSWIKYYRRPDLNTLVEKIYNESSIYLCSSLMEGWNLPATEAMACQCAVVSTDTGVVSDYAKDYETALLSSSRDAGALANNIIVLLKNKDLRIKIAKNGYEKIKEFDWGKNADTLEDYIKDRVYNRGKD